MDMLGEEGEVILRLGTTAYPMGFIFAAESSAGANDGSIPFGTTISSATVQVLSVIGEDITATSSSGVSVESGLIVNVNFKFPPLADNGQCKVLVVLTLSDTSVIAKRWDGLVIE